ncbi:hypothetical protein, partial [Runella sp.]|uniref:hypothetical protein n=1 Tax=Runella sp. TaxID=1960881 RepID=UPI00301AE186
MKPKHLLFFLFLLISTGQVLAQTPVLVKQNALIKTNLIGTAIGNKLLFLNNQKNSTNRFSSPSEVWTSDGTESGTTFIKDIQGGPKENPVLIKSLSLSYNDILYTYQNKSYFVAESYFSDGYGGISSYVFSSLIQTDGTTTGTRGLVSGIISPLRIGSDLYFVVPKPIGSNYSLIMDVNKKVVLDGTISSDIQAFPSDPDKITRLGSNWLLFATSKQTGTEALYVSNGLASGTKIISNTSGSNFMATGSGKSAFFFKGTELWITDGTSGGTKIIKNIAPGGVPVTDYPKNPRPLQDGILFTANDGVSGNELWISDGT